MGPFLFKMARPRTTLEASRLADIESSDISRIDSDVVREKG